MNICGIVCEYNPFHSGHAYQISEIRRLLGANTAIVCAMSGDFVQRGEAAAYGKHDRAHAAVMGGADLVLELPLPWSIASAERFAGGGVGLLAATGVVTHLAFGSECGDISALEEIAGLLLCPELDGLIREELTSGQSYAAARQRALERFTGRAFPQLESPNDILAVEYLKAMHVLGVSAEPLVILRRGAAHDSGEAGPIISAALLREKLRAGESLTEWIPAPTLHALEQGKGSADRELLDVAVLSRLRFLPEEAFAALPDVSEGLYHRVFRAVRTAATVEEAAVSAATKRYPVARIRRILLCAALGVRAGDSSGIPPYLRVLAANDRGLTVLRRMEDVCTLPVVTKPAKVRDMNTECQRIFELTASAADLYSLAYQDKALREGDADWRRAPFIVK